MTDRATIERLLQELHTARVRSDLSAMLQCFSDDAGLRIAGASDGKPIAVAASGLLEIRLWLGTLVKAFRLTDYALLSLLVDAPRAAAHWRVTIHSKITGTAVPTELLALLECRDDCITSYTEFFTPR